MGKQADARKRTNGSAKKGDETPPTSGSKKASRKKNDGWPWWLWVVGVVFLLACAGRIFGAPEANVKDKAATSVAGSKGATKKGSSSPKGSTMAMLELTMRLATLTDVSSKLQKTGQLDSDAAREVDKELNDIEEDINGLDGNTARDLRSMVSVVRGTLYQQTDQLSDDQVEKLNNSYTYANPRYWDDYYNKTSEDERFDWYGTWDTPISETVITPHGGGNQLTATNLGQLMQPYLDASKKVLMFGCGNSDMSEKMYKAGYEQILNIDVSQQVIDRMKATSADCCPQMTWQQMNASALTLEPDSFDVIIDKGTFDAIEGNAPLLAAAVAETHRTLKPGGLLLSATFNSAEVRVDRHLKGNAAWDCSSHPFEKAKQPLAAIHTGASEYNLHVCTRL